MHHLLGVLLQSSHSSVLVETQRGVQHQYWVSVSVKRHFWMHQVMVIQYNITDNLRRELVGNFFSANFRYFVVSRPESLVEHFVLSSSSHLYQAKIITSQSSVCLDPA